MTSDKQLLEQALEALEDTVNGCICRNCIKQVEAITAIRARLEQPEQEPVGYQYQDGYGNWCNFLGEKHYKDTLASGNFAIRPLYTTPPAAQPAAPEKGDAA